MVAELTIAPGKPAASSPVRFETAATQQDYFERLRLLRQLHLHGLLLDGELAEFIELTRHLLDDLQAAGIAPDERANDIAQRVEKLTRIRDTSHRWTMAGQIVSTINSLMIERFEADNVSAGEQTAAFVPPRRQTAAFVGIAALLVLLLAVKLGYDPIFMNKIVFPHHQTRLADLMNIRDALARYRADQGHYPVSVDGGAKYSGKGWPGTSETDWIPGLAGKYIARLPLDPRGEANPYRQFVYRSDGKDYKLLALVPEDCFYTIDKHPEMSDPLRNLTRQTQIIKQCYAYGYWTEGAENW